MTGHIFWQFARLGCVSFGGPTAHVGYFHRAFVQQNAWLDEETFSRFNALCTLLPGPSSSQLGFAIGYYRAGIIGGLQAFLGFTLPSFLIMLGVALGALKFDNANGHWPTFVAAMKLFAVIVVADACASMTSQLCRTAYQKGILIVAVSALLMGINTLLVLASAALVGAIMTRQKKDHYRRNMPQPQWLSLLLFLLLLAICAVSGDNLFSQFFLIGSSVFGGGHVMLPLIQQQLADSLPSNDLLSAYALAQAIPGPMFTAATYLGATLSPNAPMWGALLATLGIFLPGFLLVITFFRTWQRSQPSARFVGITEGLFPAMAALLVASLFAFIIPSSVHNYNDLILIAMGAAALHWLPKGLLAAASLILLAKFLI
jgi:chromate transporter